MRAVDSFRSTGCQVIGVVANGIDADLGGYGYGYGYGDAYGETEIAEERIDAATVDGVFSEEAGIAAADADDPADALLRAEPPMELIRPRRAA
jgi:polysaccharide biosynthesis transport protein